MLVAARNYYFPPTVAGGQLIGPVAPLHRRQAPVLPALAQTLVLLHVPPIRLSPINLRTPPKS
jgi:hypothetical protein